MKPASYLYFIQSGDNGPVKIGKADNVQYRMISLQTGNPERLHLLATFPMEDGLSEEKIHALLEGYRIRGEWYEPRIARDTIRLLSRLNYPVFNMLCRTIAKRKQITVGLETTEQAVRFALLHFRKPDFGRKWEDFLRLQFAEYVRQDALKSFRQPEAVTA